MKHVLLIGASGYIGSAFQNELSKRDHLSVTTATHKLGCDFDDCDLVINCAAFIPQPSVAACDQFPKETIAGNLLLPMALAEECYREKVTLMHISTACLFDESRDYSEGDEPLRGFGGHCGMYIGTKLLAEDEIRKRLRRHYIFRIRLPFDEFDGPRNYLSKLARYPQVYDHVNSMTHRGDFAKAALDLWEARAAFGTYHCCNPGCASARSIIKGMAISNLLARCPEFIPGPCNGCTLSVKKMLDAGIKIRPVEEAVGHALANWKIK